MLEMSSTLDMGIYLHQILKLKEYFGQLQKYQLKTKTLKKNQKFIKKRKKVCAMQIRNVPHFGHEAIFKFLIKKFNLLILNPIFGIKKKMIFLII